MWIKGFLRSCTPIRSVEWIVFHEAPVPSPCPANVRFVYLPWTTFQERIRKSSGAAPPSKPDYKLCDAKVFLGDAFADLIEGFDYFGWGDLDIIYGDLDRFLESLFGKWNIISFHKDMISNHLVFFRNTPELRQLYTKIPDYKSAMLKSEYASLDDTHLSSVAKQYPNAFFAEFHTTPFVNWIPWCDGTYNFPARWYWNQGKITNDLDRGYEFPYFHFMVWKGGSKFYYCESANWINLPVDSFSLDSKCNAFSITARGFTEVALGNPVKCKRITLEGKPSYSIMRRLRIKGQRLLKNLLTECS